MVNCMWNARVGKQNLGDSKIIKNLTKLLSFDMCRWKVEDEDVEVLHEVLAKHHKFLTSRPLRRL